MHCSGHAEPWTSWTPAPNLTRDALVRTLAMETPVHISTVTDQPFREISFPVQALPDGKVRYTL